MSEIGAKPEIRRRFIIPREALAFVNYVNTDVSEPLWTVCCPNRTLTSAEAPPASVNRGLIALGR